MPRLFAGKGLKDEKSILMDMAMPMSVLPYKDGAIVHHRAALRGRGDRLARERHAGALRHREFRRVRAQRPQRRARAGIVGVSHGVGNFPRCRATRDVHGESQIARHTGQHAGDDRRHAARHRRAEIIRDRIGHRALHAARRIRERRARTEDAPARAVRDVGEARGNDIQQVHVRDRHVADVVVIDRDRVRPAAGRAGIGTQRVGHRDDGGQAQADP